MRISRLSPQFGNPRIVNFLAPSDLMARLCAAEIGCGLAIALGSQSIKSQ
jgi:hypothetical protein